jgi:hypothetical protein
MAIRFVTWGLEVGGAAPWGQSRLIVALFLMLGLALLVGGANLTRDLLGRARWGGTRARLWGSVMLVEAALCLLLLLLAGALLAWSVAAPPGPVQRPERTVRPERHHTRQRPQVHQVLECARPDPPKTFA